MKLRALITGGAGFVGHTLSAYLVANGWEIISTDTVAETGILQCDVTDRRCIESVLDQAGELSHVFHLAAVTFVPTASRLPGHAIEVNVMGTVNLASALSERGWKGRLLYVGSAEVYGAPHYLPVDEAHSFNPTNPYAISKAASDYHCGYLAHTTDMDIVRLRPFNHSGPGQSDEFVLSSFAHQIARIEAGRAEPVLRVGNLRASRDFLHVADVVRAYELVARLGGRGEVYNVCSGQGHSILEALNRLLTFSHADICVEEDAARLRRIDVPEVWGSYEKLQAHTGWKPEMPFDAILQDLLTYWRRLEQPQQ